MHMIKGIWWSDHWAAGVLHGEVVTGTSDLTSSVARRILSFQNRACERSYPPIALEVQYIWFVQVGWQFVSCVLERLLDHPWTAV